jgi:hypothetical protein
MELILIIKKIFIVSFLSYLLVFSRIMFDSLSECMKANDCANRVMLLKDTHTSLKDERIASEPVDDYHNNIGCSALFKEVSYTDGSKRNEFEEKVKDDANASVGAVGVLGHFIAKNFILKDHTGVFTTGLMGCSYALSNKHSKNRIEDFNHEVDARRLAYQEATKRLSESELDDLANKHLYREGKVNGELLSKEEVLEQRNKFYDDVISMRDDVNS